LPGDRILRQQPVVAIQVHPRIRKLRLVMRQGPHCLIERHLRDTRGDANY